MFDDLQYFVATQNDWGTPTRAQLRSRLERLENLGSTHPSTQPTSQPNKTLTKNVHLGKQENDWIAGLRMQSKHLDNRHPQEQDQHQPIANLTYSIYQKTTEHT